MAVTNKRLLAIAADPAISYRDTLAIRAGFNIALVGRRGDMAPERAAKPSSGLESPLMARQGPSWPCRQRDLPPPDFVLSVNGAI